MEVEPVQMAREARKHLEEQERKARLMLCESERSHKSLDLDAQGPLWRETLIVYVKMDVSELRTQELIRGARHACPYMCEVRHQHQGLHSFSSLTEHLALVHEGTRLFHGGTDPKELAHFSEGTAEA